MEVRKDLYGVTVPSYDLEDKTEEQRKAEGVLFAESLLYMTPVEHTGKVVANFTGWEADEMPWDMPEIKQFCEGALWGLHVRDGKLTAYHAQTVLSMLYDESEDPDIVFGKYMLVATVFGVKPTQKEETVGKKEKVSFSLDLGKVKQFIADIEGDSCEGAEKRYISMTSKANHIFQLCGEEWPYLHYNEEHGPLILKIKKPVKFLADLKDQIRGGLVLYKTEELCKGAYSQEDHEPYQIGEGELIALLAETYLRGYPRIEVWLTLEEVRKLY